MKDVTVCYHRTTVPLTVPLDSFWEDPLPAVLAALEDGQRFVDGEFPPTAASLGKVTHECLTSHQCLTSVSLATF